MTNCHTVLSARGSARPLVASIPRRTPLLRTGKVRGGSAGFAWGGSFGGGSAGSVAMRDSLYFFYTGEHSEGFPFFLM